MEVLHHNCKGGSMFKKVCFVVLIAATSSQFAYALNISTSTSAVQYAFETVSGSSVTPGFNDNKGSEFLNIVDSAADSLDITGNMGLSAGLFNTGSDVYVRFNLENAAFSASLGSTALTVTSVGASDRVSRGGLAGESFAIFHITASAANVGSDTFSLPLTGLGILSAGSVPEKQVSVDFGVYNSFTDSIAQTNKLAGTSSAYVKLVDGVKVTTSPESQQADGKASFKTYVAPSRTTNAKGTVASLGSIEITTAHVAGTNIIYDQDGTTHTLPDSYVAALSTIEITGDFSNGTYFLDSNVGCANSATPPANSSAGALTLSNGNKLATQTLSILSSKPSLCHVVDGTTKIPASTYNTMIKYQPSAGSRAHADELVALGTVTLFGESEEDKNKDSDGDGITDLNDAFPNDATESVDTDSDEIGNVADLDDDNDGIPDAFELANGLDSLNFADGNQDADNDGISNLVEFQQGTDLNDRTDAGDVCLLGTPRGAANSSLLNETNLYLANPGSNTNQQTFIRLVNPGIAATAVEIYATDDSGQVSRKGPVELRIPAKQSLQFTSQDLESGNASKGLTNNLCDGQGKWTFLFRSETEIKVMGFIRTKDGFLTGLNTAVPTSGNHHYAYFFNPASNKNQESLMRVVNLSKSEINVSIDATDDKGIAATGSLALNLKAHEAKQLTATDLESGNASKGLTGSLGKGSGKWQLDVFSAFGSLAVTSVIRTKDGFLTNLSGVAPQDLTNVTKLHYVNPASETVKKNFIRLINSGSQGGTITIAGIDDNGVAAPGGDVTITLGANQSMQVTVADLENGNVTKGLTGKLGTGVGLWHLNVTATVNISVMNLIRSTGGFLTNVSQASPIVAQVNKVFFFNPGSNQNQKSSLRIVNNSNQVGSLTISGIDDKGIAAPGGNVTLNIASNGGAIITSQDLENGNSALGLIGSLGNGSGKWRLEIASDVNLEVQSLLDSPNGFITNLSVTATR
jgi:hypothetical protein